MRALRFVLAIFISLAVVLPATTVAQAVTPGETQTATLEVLKPGSRYLPARHNNQARHSTGIAVSSGAVLEARVTNNQEVVFNLVGIGSASDINQTLPKSGEWTRVTAKQDSAVFFRLRDSNSWSAAPQVEYRVVSGTIFDLPTFTYGEDTAAFLSEWNANNAPFAIIDDWSMTMLIPAGDKQYLNDLAKHSKFKNLNEAIEFYRNITTNFDKWVGVNNDPATPWNHTSNSRFFIRADINGYGSAYFRDGQHAGQNGASVFYYLANDYSWLILHEIGHGLDGIMWESVDKRDFNGAEVWNNVYASSYQSLINGIANTTNYSAGVESFRKRATDSRLATAKAGGSLNDVDGGFRLDFLLRITEKTGMDGFAKFNQRLRAAQAAGLNADATRRNDMLNQWLGSDNGFNTTAWFELNGFDLTPAKRQEAMDKTPAPLLMPLDELLPADQRAAAAKQLGLKSSYDLVTTSELAALGQKSKVVVNAQGDPASIEGRNVTLWDGTRKVATAPFRAGVANFADVPVGTYTVRYPYDRSNFAPVSNWVAAGQAGGTVAVTYGEAVIPTDTLGSVRFSMQGLGNEEFSTLDYNRSAGTLNWKVVGFEPHDYFSTEYQRTTITAPNGTVLLDESLVGDKHQGNRNAVVPAPIGTKITIRHAEGEHRMVPLRNYDKAVVSELKVARQPVTFVVTKFGLERADKPGTALTRFASELREQAHALIAESQENPGGSYAQRASVLIKAVNQMPQEQQLAAMWDYAIWLDFLLQSARN